MKLKYKNEDNFINYIEFYKICLANFDKGKIVFISDEYSLKFEL
jgi:hypothetical protein